MAIPTIPGTSRVQDQQIGVQRNAQPRIQALSSLKQAVGEANSAIGSMAGDVVDYEEKKRKAEETFAFNSSSLSFQKLHSDYLHNVKKMPDEQIVPTWSETTATWKQQQMDKYGEKLSPRAKRVFNMNLDSAIGESTAKFQVVADKLGSQRRLGAADANAEQFLKTGDPEMMAKAKASLALAVKCGDLTQEQMDQRVSQFPATLAYYQANNLIKTSPGKVLSKLQAGDWPEMKDEKQRENVEKLARTQQTDNFNDLITKNYDPTTGEVDEKTIRDAMKNGVIDTKMGQYRIDAQKRESYEGDTRQKQYVASLAHDPNKWLDEKGDDVRQELMREAAKIKNPQIMQESISDIDREYKAVQKTGLTSDAAVHRNELEVMRQMRKQWLDVIPSGNRDNRAAPYVKGGVERIETMSKEDFNEAFGRNVTRKQVLDRVGKYVDQVQEFYGNGEKQYMDWMKTKKGAEASPDEAKAQRVRLGFGEYDTTRAVRADLDSKKIDTDTAKKVLAIRFGIQ